MESLSDDLRPLEINETVSEEPDIEIDQPENGSSFFIYFGFILIFFIFLGASFIAPKLHTTKETTYNLEYNETKLNTNVICNEDLFRPIHNSLELSLEFPEYNYTDSSWLFVNINVTRSRKGIITGVTRRQQSLAVYPNEKSTVLFKDNIINYARINTNLSMKSTNPGFGQKMIFKWKMYNSSFTSLMLWVRINAISALSVIIIMRLCQSETIHLEQKLCTGLSIITILYNAPFELFNNFNPNFLTIFLGRVTASIYPAGLFFFVQEMMFICFKHYINGLTAGIAWGICVFNIIITTIDFMQIFPTQFPTNFGGYGFDVSILVTISSYICFIIPAFQLIQIPKKEAGDLGERFSQYRLIFPFFGALALITKLISVFSEVYRENSLSILAPMGLANTFAFLMEYLHANRLLLVADVYETPGSRNNVQQLSVEEASVDEGGEEAEEETVEA